MKNTETQIAAVSALVGSALTAVGLIVLGKLTERKPKRPKPMSFLELLDDNEVNLDWIGDDSDDN